MAAQKQDDQHERTFSSYVRIQVAILKTYLGRWTIGRSGERGSGISMLPARYDDDSLLICINPFRISFWRLYAPNNEHEKRRDAFTFFTCSGLDLIPLKQLPILTVHRVKDSLVIGQYGAGFRSSVMTIRILKVRRVENVHPQLMRNIWKLFLNKNHVKLSNKCLRRQTAWIFLQYRIISRTSAKVWFLCLMAYTTLIGYLIPKLFS